MDSPEYAVTFDFGQTLAELCSTTLQARLSERSIFVTREALDAATPIAWRAYNHAIQSGHEGHPWHHLMEVLLSEAGVADTLVGEVVEWLWQEQPRYNLWRKPIPGMFELVSELHESGIALGIISNSEGKLAELAEELHIRHFFQFIGDSGKFGTPKPKPEIFHYVADGLHVSPSQIIHIGDALEADVKGALAVGMRAIWFGGNANEVHALGPRVRVAQNAEETREAIRELSTM